MKKTTQLLLSAFTVLALLFTACKKTEGPKGDTGPQGAQGAPGNANVYTYTFTASLASFIGPLTGGEYQQAIAPSLFMDPGVYITDKDAVIMYKYSKTTGATEYYDAMPYLHYYNTSSYNQHYYEVGNDVSSNIIILKIRNSNNIAPYSPMTGNLKYKMVLIKGTNKLSLPNDISYENIKKIYNLKD